MCYTIFMAQLIGTFVFLTGLAMVLHHQRFHKTVSDFLASHTLVALTGQISILLGLIVVLTHNVWVSDWPVLITLIGWLVLLQGVMRVFFPEAFVRLVKDLMAKSGYTVMCWIWLLVGLYLMWVGYSQN